MTETLRKTKTVITPPDATGPGFNETGSGTYETPEKVDRLLTLAYILDHDFDIDQSAVEYTEGSTTDTMLRKEPYVRVLIEDLNRIVYVCDEEGNASYVFDTEVLEHLGITPPELDQMTKNQRNAFIRVTPAVGRRIIQSPEWRQVMSTALREGFNDLKIDELVTVERISEFAEGVKFANYTDFETAVRNAYEEAGSPSGVQDWYKVEYKRRKGWPSTPQRKYMDAGWKSYPELVGNEVTEFLKYTDFETEVRAAYEEAGSPNGVNDWYKTEQKNHGGWPAAPEAKYKDTGWKGLPELIGKEFLECSDFEIAVKAAYEKAGSPNGVQKWYTAEYPKHKGWPSVPSSTYKDSSWKSISELVGKEVVKLIEYNNFETEVRAAHKEAGSPENVWKWYLLEYKKHKGWPSNPDSTYKDNGWKSLPELVGREVVKFLKYAEFETEVRETYKKAGSPSGVAKWYASEYSKHKGWPSNPNPTYKDTGWNGFLELVGNEVVEFLKYADFETEVQEAYKKAGSQSGVVKWYTSEYLKHKGWPSQPDVKYKDKGWKSYPELVGKNDS